MRLPRPGSLVGPLTRALVAVDMFRPPDAPAQRKYPADRGDNPNSRLVVPRRRRHPVVPRDHRNDKTAPYCPCGRRKSKRNENNEKRIHGSFLLPTFAVVFYVNEQGVIILQ